VAALAAAGTVAALAAVVGRTMTVIQERNRVRRRGNQRRRGQALVPVIIVMMVLTAFAVTLAVLTRREVRAGAAEVRNAQMYYIARGAIQYAASQLDSATSGGATYPELSLPPDTDSNGWTRLGDGWYKIDIIDTASRANVNLEKGPDLARLPGLSSDPAIAAAIMDWRDADDVPTEISGSVGAESEYYSALTPPYTPKNAPFDTVDELLLVRGITPTLLYGRRDSTGAVLPLTETTAPLSRQATGTVATDTGTPLCEMLTTYSRERNVDSDGNKRINVKTAGVQQLVNDLGLSNNLAQRLIQSRGDGGQNLTSIAGLLDTQGFTRALMQQIGDKVTVTDDEYRNGVININTAPAEVLATIPNVDETIYNAIIEARQGGTVFSGLNDLFQLTSLNRQQLQALVDNVCTKSSVYLVRLKVRALGSNEVRGYQALVEVMPPTVADDGTTTATPASIYQFREVGRNPGWASWTTGAFSSGGSIGI
jgi:type II secretory pathway component PulK